MTESVRDRFWCGIPEPVAAWAALKRDGTLMAASVRERSEDVRLVCGRDCVPLPVMITPIEEAPIIEAPINESTMEYRMVAVFRADITIPPGKMAAQAGHAFLSAWRQADRQIADEYAGSAQVKIVLLAPDLPTLERIVRKALQRSVPAALITDAARTVFAEPTVTVLGLGPMTKTDSNALTRGLVLLE